MTGSPRVLILSAGYGAGHLQAARALEAAISITRPAWETHVYNFIELVSPFFDLVSRYFYLSLVRRFPRCYGWFYRQTDKHLREQGYVLDSLGRSALKGLLAEVQPHLLVATFPTPGRVAAALRLRGELKVPVAMVLTDHTAHAEWVHPGVDLYLVPDGGVRQTLIRRGVSPGKIEVIGVPIHPCFAAVPDRQVARQRLGLAGGQPVILVMGGGFSRVAAIEEMCAALSRLTLPLQVLVVTGRDKVVWRRLTGRFGQDPRFRFYGFVENVVEFMAAADLLVGKAGALTLAEAAAAGLPVIIYRCLPGQEEANALYYVRSGGALWVKSLEELVCWVVKVLRDEDGAGSSLRQGIKQLARPEAAKDAAALLAGLAEKGGTGREWVAG